MKIFRLLFKAVSVVFLLSFVVACSDDNNDPEPVPEVNLVKDILKEYSVDRMKTLTISPTIEGFKDAVFKWTVTKNEVETATSTDKDLNFITIAEGTYNLSLLVSANGVKDTTVVSKIVVKTETSPYSAYISTVSDFLPSIGQFTNKLPTWEEGNTHANMVKKAGDALIGSQPSMVSLGGFGGYVEFGFDHTIVNVKGKRDFRVLGNAFWAATNPNKPGSRGGSCEPGVIMVAYDKNQSGKADEDEWYEIAGSEHASNKATKDYEITFFRPAVEAPGATGEYIKWEDNQGKSGYKPKNAFHKQSYYPNWITGDKVSFKGTLLPNNAIDESGQGTYWVLYAFEYGYADNAPNADDESAIDIDWAVDKEGNKVHLPGVDFIKVYNGTNQEAGWLGEVSTEVAGAYDLHVKGEDIATRE